MRLLKWIMVHTAICHDDSMTAGPIPNYGIGELWIVSGIGKISGSDLKFHNLQRWRICICPNLIIFRDHEYAYVQISLFSEITNMLYVHFSYLQIKDYRYRYRVISFSLLTLNQYQTKSLILHSIWNQPNGMNFSFNKSDNRDTKISYLRILLSSE